MVSCMTETLHWFLNIEVKWRLAVAVVFVALLNPVFDPLTQELSSPPNAVEHRVIRATFARNYAPVIKRLRDQSIWIEKKQIAPVVVENTLSAADLENLAAQARASQNWILIGLIQIGDERRAVLKRGGEYLHDLKEGDELPSGERIVSINQDTILLALSDGKRQLVLYPIDY